VTARAPRPQAVPDLAAVVDRLAGGRFERIGEVHRDAVDYDAFLAGRTVARVRGTAVRDGVAVPWSLIEKQTQGRPTASEYLYANAAREFAAYRSGLLDDLAPGLRAPQLLAADEREDGRLTLWVEDVGPDTRKASSPEQVVVAARHLGRLAGRWVGRAPDLPWLFRGWMERHSQPHAIAEGLRVVRRARGDRQIAERLGGRLEQAEGVIRLQDEYGRVLRARRETLCHHDAVAANVFAHEGDGGPETILIDWESVGPGPVGADLASLLFGSARRGDLSATLLPGLMRRAVAAYADGVTEMGAQIRRHELRLAFHASISLRWTLVRDVIRVLDGTSVARRGSAPRETPDDALDELVALVGILLDSAAETRRLTSVFG